MEIKTQKQTQLLNSGFTLIELLVVIAIIALLASVVLLALNGTRAKARDARRIADMNQLAKAMELFFSDYNSYPTVSASKDFANSGFYNMGFGREGTAGSVITGPGMIPKYMSQLPTPPAPADGGCANTATPGSNDYYWYSTGGQTTAATYAITFCLGNVTGGLTAGSHTLTQGGFQ